MKNISVTPKWKFYSDGYHAVIEATIGDETRESTSPIGYFDSTCAENEARNRAREMAAHAGIQVNDEPRKAYPSVTHRHFSEPTEPQNNRLYMFVFGIIPFLCALVVILWMIGDAIKTAP